MSVGKEIAQEFGHVRMDPRLKKELAADIDDALAAQSARIAELAAEVARLREAAIGAVSSLAAAISLLERSPKKAAPSDRVFDIMLDDYRHALENARAALQPQPTKPGA